MVTSYVWNFGDGSTTQTTTTNQVSHNYTHNNGPYTVQVDVFTSASTNNHTSAQLVIQP